MGQSRRQRGEQMGRRTAPRVPALSVIHQPRPRHHLCVRRGPSCRRLRPQDCKSPHPPAVKARPSPSPALHASLGCLRWACPRRGGGGRMPGGARASAGGGGGTEKVVEGGRARRPRRGCLSRSCCGTEPSTALGESPSRARGEDAPPASVTGVRPSRASVWPLEGPSWAPGVRAEPSREGAGLALDRRSLLVENWPGVPGAAGAAPADGSAKQQSPPWPHLSRSEAQSAGAVRGPSRRGRRRCPCLPHAPRPRGPRGCSVTRLHRFLPPISGRMSPLRGALGPRPGGHPSPGPVLVHCPPHREARCPFASNSSSASCAGPSVLCPLRFPAPVCGVA